MLASAEIYLLLYKIRALETELTQTWIISVLLLLFGLYSWTKTEWRIKYEELPAFPER